jgi:hypothetical protein
MSLLARAYQHPEDGILEFGPYEPLWSQQTGRHIVGWFNGKRSAKSDSGSDQIPDRLAREAAAHYGQSRFSAALDSYGEAIDKIHTMCVMAAPGSRIRFPGQQDQPILDGFVSSLGATLAMDPHADLRAEVERTSAYLYQIAAESPDEGQRYRKAIADIELAYRLGRA